MPEITSMSEKSSQPSNYKLRETFNGESGITLSQSVSMGNNTVYTINHAYIVASPYNRNLH